MDRASGEYGKISSIRCALADVICRGQPHVTAVIRRWLGNGKTCRRGAQVSRLTIATKDDVAICFPKVPLKLTTEVFIQMMLNREPSVTRSTDPMSNQAKPSANAEVFLIVTVTTQAL